MENKRYSGREKHQSREHDYSGREIHQSTEHDARSHRGPRYFYGNQHQNNHKSIRHVETEDHKCGNSLDGSVDQQFRLELTESTRPKVDEHNEQNFSENHSAAYHNNGETATLQPSSSENSNRNKFHRNRNGYREQHEASRRNQYNTYSAPTARSKYSHYDCDSSPRKAYHPNLPPRMLKTAVPKRWSETTRPVSNHKLADCEEKHEIATPPPPSDAEEMKREKEASAEDDQTNSKPNFWKDRRDFRAGAQPSSAREEAEMFKAALEESKRLADEQHNEDMAQIARLLSCSLNTGIVGQVGAENEFELQCAEQMNQPDSTTRSTTVIDIGDGSGCQTLICPTDADVLKSITGLPTHSTLSQQEVAMGFDAYTNAVQSATTGGRSTDDDLLFKQQTEQDDGDSNTSSENNSHPPPMTESMERTQDGARALLKDAAQKSRGPSSQAQHSKEDNMMQQHSEQENQYIDISAFERIVNDAVGLPIETANEVHEAFSRQTCCCNISYDEHSELLSCSNEKQHDCVLTVDTDHSVILSQKSEPKSESDRETTGETSASVLGSDAKRLVTDTALSEGKDEPICRKEETGKTSLDKAANSMHGNNVPTDNTRSHGPHGRHEQPGVPAIRMPTMPFGRGFGPCMPPYYPAPCPWPYYPMPGMMVPMMMPPCWPHPMPMMPPMMLRPMPPRGPPSWHATVDETSEAKDESLQEAQ